LLLGILGLGCRPAAAAVLLLCGAPMTTTEQSSSAGAEPEKKDQHCIPVRMLSIRLPAESQLSRHTNRDQAGRRGFTAAPASEQGMRARCSAATRDATAAEMQASASFRTAGRSCSSSQKLAPLRRWHLYYCSSCHA
jgi:hypothetical protein